MSLIMGGLSNSVSMSAIIGTVLQKSDGQVIHLSLLVGPAIRVSTVTV